MRHLIVYTHPHEKSFNHAILETLTQALKNYQQEIRVRDLYALNFDPVLKAKEIIGFQKGKVPADIKREQDHIRWADVIIFISPIWWGGVTSILRGYFDRVFSNKFAYEESESGVKGLLSTKKIFTINTIGAPEKLYQEAGLFDCMNKILDEIIFKFCDAQVLGHKYFSFVTACSDQERKAMLDDVKAIAGLLSQS